MEFLQSFVLPAGLAAVVAYLLGSISFSIIFTRLFDKKDIRSMGSGNAGMTNVLRSVGWKAGLCTFIFDFSKGVVSVFLGKVIFSWLGSGAAQALSLPQGEITQYGAYIAGFFCVMGHIFPVFFGFRGGKGILTSWAIVALIDWRAFLAVIIVFIVVFLASRIVSLASLCAAASFPFFTILFNYFIDYRGGNSAVGHVSGYYPVITTVVALLLSLTVIIKHKENIKRIRAGTEKKISVKK